ncbi:MAG: hypothetical protein WKG07_14700 [Hymenobacter sp.]
MLRIISKRKAIRARRACAKPPASRDLRFDTVDVVDIILELERSFHIIIPDEVPLYTVGDFVRYVRRARRTSSLTTPQPPGSGHRLMKSPAWTRMLRGLSQSAGSTTRAP